MNYIGLSDGTDFIKKSKDVVLNFPYKDCILEGGQSKEEQSLKEFFYNETLTNDEVDRLLHPKVFTNIKKYTKDGEEENPTFKHTDNLLIKGNNLIALHSLSKRYEGRVKLICIDPPYNKGSDEYNYNDTFNHSSWLTFMKNRLEISKKILDKNGTIFIFCDDNEQSYLRILMDEIFGKDRFISTVIWKNSDNSNNDAKKFSNDHNYIIVFSNNDKWESFRLDRTEEQSSHYKNPNNDPKGPWFDGNPVNSPNPRKNLMYKLKTPSGKYIDCPPNGWRWDKDTINEKIESGEIVFNSDETKIKRITYLNEQKGLPPSTLWNIDEEYIWDDLDETGHTRQAKYEQKKYFPSVPTKDLFKTPKPEKVIKKILDISTEEDDIVLDFFGGSGTTAAVSHKMKRQWITVEQMEYIDRFLLNRLLNVLNGDNIGISSSVNWKGGGEFTYIELMKNNQTYIDTISECTTSSQLIEIKNELKNSNFIRYEVKDENLFDDKNQFDTLPMDEQKEILIKILDKNHLYVNYSEMDDKQFDISDEVKKFNREFYEVK